MDTKSKYLNPVLAIVLCMSTSCTEGLIHRNGFLLYENADPECWNEGQPIEMIPDSSDISGIIGSHVRPVFTIRYSTLSDVETIPLEFLQESFIQPEKRDTVILRLFDKTGNPSGRGTYSVFELTDTLPAITVTEGWRLTVTPLSKVKGIQAVGISFESLTD